MQPKGLKTAVALFVFNRPDTTLRVFEAIARIRPQRLLLISDGPRREKLGEVEKCRQVREILTCVNWPCEVSTNFVDSNIGCQERMISGLNWVFSLVEEAIILEDDCLPDPSFFPYCEELLAQFRADGRIAYISGCNLQESYQGKHLRGDASYFFSQIGGIWGWATWRSEWLEYDRHMSDWPEIKRDNKLAEIFDRPDFVTFWTRIFDAMYEKRGPNTWDYQWLYSGLKNHKLVIVPRKNLIENIGFGKDATHTVEKDKRFMRHSSPIELPLKHPSTLIPSRTLDRLRVQDMLSVPFKTRTLRKIRRLLVPTQ